MCSIRVWYWNFSQKCYGPNPDPSRSFPIHSQCRTETDNLKVPFWSQPSWISRPNRFIQGSITTNSQGSKFPKQIEIRQIEKAFAAISGVRRLLQNLYSEDDWKVPPVLKTLNSRSPNQHHLRDERNLWLSKQSTEWCMRTRIETSHSLKAVCPNDGRKLQRRRRCPHDWRQPRSKNAIKEEDICACRAWIKSFSPAQLKLPIYSKEFLAIYMEFLELAHVLWEATKPTVVLTEQQIGQTIHPGKSCSTIFVERMRLCAAVQL